MSNDITRLDRADTIAMYLSIAIAAIAIVLAGWGMVDRLAEVAPGHDIPIAIPLTPEQGEWAFGLFLERVDPGGEFAGSVGINSVTMPIVDPSQRTLVALWADTITRFVFICAGSIVAATFLRRVARGKALERGSARLIVIGTGIVAIEWLVHALLTAISTSEVRSYLFDNAHEGPPALDLAPIPWILFLAAVGVAFHMGEKLRRETAGLV